VAYENQPLNNTPLEQTGDSGAGTQVSGVILDILGSLSVA